MPEPCGKSARTEIGAEPPTCECGEVMVKKGIYRGNQRWQCAVERRAHSRAMNRKRSLSPHECGAKGCRKPAHQRSSGRFDIYCSQHQRDQERRYLAKKARKASALRQRLAKLTNLMNNPSATPAEREAARLHATRLRERMIHGA